MLGVRGVNCGLHVAVDLSGIVEFFHDGGLARCGGVIVELRRAVKSE